MKAKYDREGVNFIEDEKDIGRQEAPKKRGQLGPEFNGPPPLTYKPQNLKDVNMGGSGSQEGNPFSMALSMANNVFSSVGGKK